MKKTIGISILLILVTIFSYAQMPKLKKEIIIETTYDYSDIKDKSQKAKEDIDTLVIEYNKDGFAERPLFTSSNEYVRFVESIGRYINDTKIDTQYWSNSIKCIVYTQYFKDSIVEFKLLDKDTIQFNRYYFNKNISKSDQILLSNNTSYEKVNRIVFYELKTKHKEKATVIRMYPETGLIDTFKLDLNYKKMVFKKLVFNPIDNKWFIKEKNYVKKEGQITFETSYNLNIEKYTTKKITMKFNDYGFLISSIKYDMHNKRLESNIFVSYEYY